MEHTLPNGAVITGTLDQVNKVRLALGFDPLFVDDGVHYNSESKGIVRINTMDTRHIKNAIRKRWSNMISALDTSVPADKFLESVRAPTRDLTLIGLVAELSKRRDEKICKIQTLAYLLIQPGVCILL